MNLTWHVYQFRSDTELLYVGHTRWLKQRFQQHKRSKPWWSEVTDIRSEEFATEDDARLREKEIWRADRPKYNRVSPFMTPEEQREQGRLNAREYRAALPPDVRTAHRKRNADRERERRATDPEYRERMRQFDRERNRRGRRSAERWQQTGPGLF